MSIRTAGTARLAALLIAGLALLLCAGGVAAQADQPAGVGNDAVAALNQMSKTLQAKQVSFQARTLRAYAGPNGEMLHIVHAYKTVLSRPDRLLIDVNGDDGASQLVDDGKNLIVYVAATKKYASISVPNDVDKALDAAEERTGIDFPLADLLDNDPADSLLANVTSGGQVGTATIDGTKCRHFFFVQAKDDLEWELWLEDNERALPRRVVITYRSLPGRPIFVAELSNWDFSAPLADSAFTFVPPAGVTKVEFATRANISPGGQK